MIILTTKAVSTGKSIRGALNYGLMIDSNDLTRGLELAENQVNRYPFADRGDMIWSADSAKYIPWDKDAPVVITNPRNEDPRLDTERQLG